MVRAGFVAGAFWVLRLRRYSCEKTNQAS